MTIHREWQHSMTLAPISPGSPPNVAWAQGVTVPGNVIVTGGGYAEYVNSGNSNESSTDTTGNSASLPIAGIMPYYDATSDLSSLMVGFHVMPQTKVRAHILTVWED